MQYSCLENPMDGGAWWAAVHGVAKSWIRLSDFTSTFHFHFSLSCIGEGNGNPLQCPCLENPRDWGAWWAAVYGVAQSLTRLKQLSNSSSSRELRSHRPSGQLNLCTTTTETPELWGPQATAGELAQPKNTIELN